MSDRPSGSRNSTIRIINELSERVRTVPDRDARENRELWQYLEAAAAWIEDMDGYHVNRGQPVPESPTWETVADIFQAALVYE